MRYVGPPATGLLYRGQQADDLAAALAGSRQPRSTATCVHSQPGGPSPGSAVNARVGVEAETTVRLHFCSKSDPNHRSGNKVSDRFRQRRGWSTIGTT